MSLTKEQIAGWLESIDDYGMGDGQYWIPTKEAFSALCETALRSLDSPVSAITAHPDPLDIRSYGFDEPDVDGTKEWIERMGGIFGETFKGLAEAHPAMIVRQMAKLVIAQARAAAPVAQEAVAWYRYEETNAFRGNVYYESNCWPDLIPLYAAPVTPVPEDREHLKMHPELVEIVDRLCNTKRANWTSADARALLGFAVLHASYAREGK